MMSGGQPLDDLVVIELGHSVAAPFAAEILADLGARVIKVEKPDDGDDARNWAPPYLGGMSATFQSLNRNKYSVVVDLKDADATAELRNYILENADVVIQNLRPGGAAKAGLDAETLQQEKPELICCNIGAFGAGGPLKDLPGYDPLMQAFAGIMSITGEPGQRPVRVGTSVVDMAAGMWSVIGILAALLNRKDDGKGCRIDTSLYETALTWMCYHAAGYLGSGKVPKRQGSGAAMIVPYRGYETTDGFIVVAAGNDKLFAILAHVLDRSQWIDDPRYRTNANRVVNQEPLYGELETIIAGRSTAEWQEVFDCVGLPNAPMQTIDQVLKHPQTEALGMLQTSPDGSFSLLGLPLSFDGLRPEFRKAPPELGSDTAEILKKSRD